MGSVHKAILDLKRKYKVKVLFSRIAIPHGEARNSFSVKVVQAQLEAN